MKKTHLSMITIASEQLLPHLEAVAHFFGNNLNGGTFHIIHTADQARSKRPAELLCELLKRKFSNLNTQLVKKPVNPLPEEVQQITESIIQSSEPETQWIINATGGTKLMSAPLLEMSGRNNIKVIYRELSQNKWYEIKRNPDGKLISEEFLIEIAPLAHYSVSELLHAQLGIPATENGFELNYEPVGNINFFKLINAQIEEKGNSEKAFPKLGLPIKSPGMSFETVISTMIKSFGLNDIACNVIFSKEQKQFLQEIDIVINNGQKLLFVDCKLRTAEEEKNGRVEGITSQIRQAAETRRKFGGLGAELMLLRPNRLFTEAEKELCLLHNLKVIDRDQILNLLPELYKFCTATHQMPKELQNLQDKISGEIANGNMVYFRPFLPTPIIQNVESAGAKTCNLEFYSKQTGTVDFIMGMDRLLTQDLQYSGRKWSLIYFNNLFLLSFIIPDKNTKLDEQSIFSEESLPVEILIKGGKIRKFVLFRLKTTNPGELSQIVDFFRNNQRKNITLKSEPQPTANRAYPKKTYQQNFSHNRSAYQPIIRKRNQ
jgi:Holliday junction resolvase-like predicted endonuclease